MKTLCFCFKTLLQINSGEGLQKVVPKIIDIPLVKQAFRDGAFYDSRTRTCIGDNGLRSLLHALYEPLLSDLNPAYIYKQKR